MGAARPPLRIDPGSAAAAVELNDQRQSFGAAGGKFAAADSDGSCLARRGDRDRRSEREQLFRCTVKTLFPADGIVEGARLFRGVDMQTGTGIERFAVLFDDKSGDGFLLRTGFCDVSGKDLLALLVVPFADIERVDVLPPVARAAGIEQIGDALCRFEIFPCDRRSAAPDGQPGLFRQVVFPPLQKELVVAVLRTQVGKFPGRQNRRNGSGSEQGQEHSLHVFSISLFQHDSPESVRFPAGRRIISPERALLIRQK